MVHVTAASKPTVDTREANTSGISGSDILFAWCGYVYLAYLLVCTLSFMVINGSLLGLIQTAAKVLFLKKVFEAATDGFTSTCCIWKVL
eukprot:SAG11_NODE_21216_length_429_cov_1.409091_1_plen_89_part_00